jgi:predicted metal-dependent phosphoesterase TrpH
MEEELCADLHIHTRASDGVMDLADVVKVAAHTGLSAVAVTDHDRLHPELDARICHVDGIEVIHGIEIRVRFAKTRVDLLGYGVRPTPELDDLLRSIQQSRIDRAGHMIASLERALDVSIDLIPSVGIGRPEIAAAVVDTTEYDSTERVFDELIGEDCRHYVPRWVPDARTAIDALRGAGALIGLAHPYRYAQMDTATAIVDDIDAIEAYYPYVRQPGEQTDPARIEQIAARAGVVVTGGSDAHDRELGKAGLDVDRFRSFREALTEAGRRTA